MPGYRSHMVGGALFSGGVLALFAFYGDMATDPVSAGAFVAVGVAAALFPDVDTDSRGQNFYYGLLAAIDLALIAAGMYKWAAILGLAAMLPAIGRHRGWTHRLWAAFVVPLPILVVVPMIVSLDVAALAPYYLAAVAGYLSHLALDRVF